MFPRLGLLNSVTCPQIGDCQRNCLFSHSRPSEPPAKRQKVEASPRSLHNVAADPRTSTPAPIASTSRPQSAPVNRPQSASVNRLEQAPRLALVNQLNSYAPLTMRNELLKLFWDEYRRIYAGLPQGLELASRDAQAQERNVYDGSVKPTYRNAAAQTLAKLKKRPVAPDALETGTNEVVERYQSNRAAEQARVLSREMVADLVVGQEMATRAEYVLSIPEGEGSAEPEQTGVLRQCKRCSVNYEVKKPVGRDEISACRYHPGRIYFRTGTYTCCQSADPCSRGPHVFEDKAATVLHARRGFVTTAEISTAKEPLDVVALDCELVYTTAGLSLARLTVISGQRAKVLDELIRPQGDLVDPITQFSGIKREDIEKAVLDLAAVRKALGTLINANTILIGHALENDLRALRLVHPPDRIIDTAVLYPHAQGLPYRMSLRRLVKQHLKEDTGVHDSFVDASSAMDLVLLAARKRRT